MASEATPRINAKYLDSFTNQIVRILGKVVSLRGETATIDANGSINVHLNRVSHSDTIRQGGERLWKNKGMKKWGTREGREIRRGGMRIGVGTTADNAP